jgi:hypothetical protein
MTTQSDTTPLDAGEAADRIRRLTEQILEAGSSFGLGLLDAYEQGLRTVADLQSRAADEADVKWLSELARAHADFTREVARVSASVARQALQG